MLKCFTVIVLCYFCIHFNGEVVATPDEALIEATLRNLLVIREAFPKVPKFWQELIRGEKAKKLRPKFWGTAFKFVRAASKVAFKVAKVVALTNPVLGIALEVAEAVTDVALDHVKTSLDNSRPPTAPPPTTSPPPKIFACSDPGLTGCWNWVEYMIYRTRKSFDITQKLLNDVVDPKRTIRGNIYTALTRLQKCKASRSNTSQPSLMLDISLITNSLVTACAALTVTSVEG